MKFKTVTKNLVFLTAFLFLLTPGFASAEEETFTEREKFETVTVPSGKFNLPPGSVKVVELEKGWRKVKTAFVQAEALNRQAKIEVWVNGNRKHPTLLIPASDPSYAVAINEVVHSLEFRHVDGGEVRVLDVKVTQSLQIAEDLDDAFDPNIYKHEIRYHAYSKIISALAEAVIRKVEQIEPHLDVKLEYVPYMLPVKMAASSLYAASVGQSEKHEVRVQLKAVLEAINYSRPVIDRLLRTKFLDRKAIDLLALRYAIKEELE